jgi:hypothetical protein
MADTSIINLGDATMVEKHDRSCPKGSNNKPKASAVVASSSTLAKHRCGRPLGSKNKPKIYVVTTGITKDLDVV